MPRVASGCRTALAALLVLCAGGNAWALTGNITNLSGAVIAKRTDGQSRILSLRSEVFEGDLVATADNSYARVKFTDGTEVVLRPGTQLKIDSFKYEEQAPEKDSIFMSLLKGGLRSVTGLMGKRSPGSFSLATPNATIGIRGTNFGAMFCNNDCGRVPMPGGGAPPNGLHVDVADGAIVVSTPAGAAEFRVGQFGYVASPNTPPVVVPAQQGAKVTLPPQATGTQTSPAGGGVGKAGENECKL